MNYQKIYEDLVLRAKSENRKKVKDGTYYENHHIIPKCMGGSDSKENLVLLTGREHFVAHKLLVEINPEVGSLKSALWMLMITKSPIGLDRDYRVSSREYEEIKITNAKITSLRLTGIKRSEEFKANLRRPLPIETITKMSESKKGVKKPESFIIMLRNRVYTESHKLNLSNSNRGQKRSADAIKNMKEAIRPPISEETKVKMRSNMKIRHANNTEIYTCLYCGVSSKIKTTIIRWHNDNCLSNPNLSELELKTLKTKRSWRKSLN